MSVGEQFGTFLLDVWSSINKLEEHALATGLESDISITEINIIAKIGHHEGVRMSDAARIIGVTLATLTVACDKLEAKGLVQRTRDPSDRRVVKISLTPKGMAAYEFHRQFHAKMFEAVLGALSPEEERIFTRCLEKLQDLVDELPEQM